MATPDAPPLPGSLCPLCGGVTYEVGCKLYCSRCHALVGNCEDDATWT